MSIMHAVLNISVGNTIRALKNSKIFVICYVPVDDYK